MSAQHTPGRGCAECAWGKVAGCWKCGSRIAPGHYNEEPEVWRRHFVADVGSARSAHRTALVFARKGYAPEFIQQARAVRDSSLVSARLSLQAYRAAIAKATGSAA